MRFLVLAMSALLSGPALAQNQPGTAKAFLNGVATPVFFNDGDSFRILGGPYQGSQSRLSGFNSLESFGPAHQWGTWTPEELYHFAKLSTYNGRRGVWHCESDLARDGYGRMLWFCKDLALSQIKNGWAHAYSVNDDPADADLMAAQNEAMAAKRGMWAHGVPDYVLTSTPSVSEGYPDTYNRLLSTKDGRSKKWLHKQNYGECQMPCMPTDDPDADAIAAAAKELKSGPNAALFEPYTEALLIERLTEYVTTGVFGELPPGVDRYTIEKPVTRIVASGALHKSRVPVACMLNVDFTRRYGANQAACLK